MRTRTFRWLVAGIVLLACGWWVYNVTGPRFKGRSAAYWFRAYDTHEQNRTALAFRTMGSNVVPLLIAELEAPPSRIGEAFNSFQNLFRQWRTTYNELFLSRKANAAYLLGEMGEAANPAIPALETASSNSMSFVAIAAKVALIKIRKESLTPHIELLRDRSDYPKWSSSAMLLGAFGTNASAAVPLLLEALQRSHSIIQRDALMALGMMRSEPQACVPAVTPYLTNADITLRRYAFFTLLSFKNHARSASNEIALGLSDIDPWIRSQALRAVNEVLTPTEQQTVLPAAKALLNDTNPIVRDSAKKLLREIRASAAK